MQGAEDQYTPQESGAPAPEHDPYAALRHPGYRRLLSGGVLSGAAAEMLSVAVGWELYQRTNSAYALGLVGLIQFLPVLLLSLPAGHAADRYSRKLLLVGGLCLMSLASLSLAALSFWEGPVPLIYLCLLVAGVSRAFSMPARWALVPQVVPDRVLPNAIAWNSSGWQIASMVGPSVGGLILGLTGQAAGAYLLAACCTLSCAGLIASIRPRAEARRREPITLASLLAGVRFVWRTKLILATLTLDLFAVLLGGATALLPIFAKDILHVGPVGLGWLRAAPSIGALGMALFLAHRPPLRRAGWTLVGSVAGFGVATIVFGLSEDPLLSFLMLALTGALDNVSVVVRGTLIQVLTPDAMRGRVSAVNAVFIGSSNELGAFESGVTAEWFGPVGSVVLGGAGTVLVVLGVMALWPQVLRLGALHGVQPAGVPEEGPVVPPTDALIETHIEKLQN
jgi:MFS family permease